MPCIKAAIAASSGWEVLSYRVLLRQMCGVFGSEPGPRVEKLTCKASETDLLPLLSSTSNHPTTMP
jgi:hypothetical protein